MWNWKKIAIGVLAVVLVMTSCTSVGAMDAKETVGDGGDRITRILLLGCDRTASLADTVMLVTINETAKQARILQIPRDTYAEYTKNRYKKLNGAVNALGLRGFESFLEDTLGVQINCYVALKPDALVGVVNAIGGVDVVIPQDMKYSDPTQGLTIDLPAGPRHLTGEEAEQFVRFRSGYANADLGRLDAQKVFLKAFAKRCQSLSAMEMIGAAMHALTTVQTNIGVHDAIRLVGVLRACNTDDIPMATMPGQAARGESGAWYYVINREGGCRAVEEYLLPETPFSDADFDPKRTFDREENSLFHAVYTASEEMLPQIWETYQKKKPK